MPRLYLSPPRRTFAVLAAAVAAFSLMQSLVTPVLPTIQHDLHTSATAVTWVLTAWLLAASVATPLMGRVGDMIGKDRTLLAALAAIALGCLLAAAAPNIGVLIAGRVVQGVGSAVFPVSFGIVRDEIPPHRVPSAVGVLSAVIASGGGIGIVLAGPIVGALNWRWLFWIPMVVVLLVATAAARFVPPSPIRSPGRINWLAASLLSAWLVALLLPLSQGSTWGWTDPVTLGLFGLAAALCAAWLTVEVRSVNPLIDMRMMRLGGVWTTNLAAMLSGASMFGVYAFLPRLMQTPAAGGYGLGASVTRSGLIMLPMLVTMAVAGSLSGPAARWIGSRAQLALGAALSALSCASFAILHNSAVPVAIAGGVFGLGLGMVYAAMINLVVQSVPAAQTGVASGMNTNIRTIGAAMGTAMVSAVVTAHQGPAGLPAESGYVTAFTLLAACSTAAAAVALLVPPSRRRRPSAPPATVGAAPAELTPVEV
ncbi:MFS transporter [Mangrovihabitans endophyticus]|uniref:MFS transporter n=1 Tax=Mangrovihabitans endophyticus TaxID=1751298 RepID=A0A8J3BVD3_9ACTN|nr:MFS transporter [Mangrovihabitans endophyticus]GGK80948.1 MFS transporter [Mangrovihabitans endophyticus]